MKNKLAVVVLMFSLVMSATVAGVVVGLTYTPRAQTRAVGYVSPILRNAKVERFLLRPSVDNRNPLNLKPLRGIDHVFPVLRDVKIFPLLLAPSLAALRFPIFGAAGGRQQGSAAGGGLANVVEDLTPQLGGNLDMNGNSIIDDAGNMTFGDGSAAQTITLDMATGDVVILSTGAIQSVSGAGTNMFGNISLAGDKIGRVSDSHGIIFNLSGSAEFFGSEANSATAIAIEMGSFFDYTTDGAKLVAFGDDFQNTFVEVAAIYADGEIQAGQIEADAPAVNVVCDAGAVGIRVYVNDTNDAAPGRNCYCTQIDDTATFDYRDANGVTNAVCDQI